MTTVNTSAASIGILVTLIVFTQLTSASSSLLSSKTFKTSYAATPPPASAPPGFAFTIVWVLLYGLAAVALWLQITAPTPTVSSAVQWTGVAFMMLQLVIGFAWMPVFAAGHRKYATWMIVGMLMLSGVGIVLAAATNTVAAALWAPYVAWLVFALVLSAQGNVNEVRP